MTSTTLYPSLLPPQGVSLTRTCPEEDITNYIHQHIVYQAGTDAMGRPIIVLCLCNFLDPLITPFDTILDILLSKFSELKDRDYVAVIFATHSQHQPSPWWIWKAYSSVDRSYRKNVKQMYIVHPNNFLTSIISVFFTLISPKFARKLVYVHTLSSLPSSVPPIDMEPPSPVSEVSISALPLHDLRIPAITLAYDHHLDPLWIPSLPCTLSHTLLNQVKDIWTFPVVSEFGIPPTLIRTPIPRSVALCARTVAQNCETQGIFRRTPMHSDVVQVKSCLDQHAMLSNWPPHEDEWALVTTDVSVKDQTVLVAAALLTRWVRELPEAIIDEPKLLALSGRPLTPTPSTSGTYVSKAPSGACEILFPPDHPPQLRLTMAVIGAVLVRVANASTSNDMPAGNLARVWAVNLLRTQDPANDMQVAADTDSVVHWIIKDWCFRWDHWFGQLRPQVEEILGIKIE